MKLIDVSDLELWASKPDSKHKLPELVSRLIRATSPGLNSLFIPKGSMTYRGGWDGIIDSASRSEFVPEGISLWELGTEKDTKGKAEGDYKKRTDAPLGYERSMSTFVFVTLRVWEKKGEWVDQKRSSSDWKEIVVLDAANLVEWLMISPIQSAWLANEIGKASDEGYITLNEFWNGWSRGRKFQLPPQIITAGRSKQMAELSEKLSGDTTVNPVQAASREEAIAFVCGAVLQLEQDLSESLQARALVIHDAHSFRQLSANFQNLILIADFESSGGWYDAAKNGHIVVAPLGADETVSEAAIVLPKLGRNGFIAALQLAGVTDEEARRLSRETARDITILRRREEFGITKVPEWSKREHSADILPAMVVGRWCNDVPGDRAIIELMANDSYEGYINRLTKWKSAPDTAIYQIGHVWRIASPLDAWSYLAKYLTSQHIDLLRSAFLKVYSQVDPRFELPPEQRIMASFLGKKSEYSGALLEGLAQTVILISLYGQAMNLQVSQDLGDQVISKLFQNASVDLWRSLEWQMRLLAEISPTSFLQAVEESLKNPICAALELFTEESTLSIVGKTSYHSGLLWALECIAWTQALLSRSAMILAQLAENHPGGSTSNRPINSLVSIFLPWYPQTSASITDRMSVLRKINDRFPKVGWDLLNELLPHSDRSASVNPSFRWRLTTMPSRTSFSRDDASKQYPLIVDLMIESAGNDNHRNVRLISHLFDLPQSEQQKVIAHVSNQVNQIQDSQGELWNSLRSMTARHRNSSYLGDRLAKPEADALNELCVQLEPHSPSTKFRWMFMKGNQQFDLPDSLRNSRDERERFVQDQRNSALRSIISEVGLSDTLELAADFEPYAFGHTLAHVLGSTGERVDAFTRLYNGSWNEKQVANLFIRWVSSLHGFDSILEIKNYLTLRNSASSYLTVLTCLHLTKELLHLIKSEDQATQDAFWKSSDGWVGLLDVEDRARAIEKLINYRRFQAVMNGIHETEHFSSETILKLLEGIVREPSTDELDFGSEYPIAQLFEELDKRSDVDETRMAMLEYSYLPLLASYNSRRKPKLLHAELTNNPEFFVTVISWRAEQLNKLVSVDDAEADDDSNIRDRGRQAEKLLETWRGIPGLDETGEINPEALEAWVTDVRTRSSVLEILPYADRKIGHLLAYHRDSIPDWPGKAICRIIDSVNSEDLWESFASAVFNRYGSTVRGAFDGGKIEHERAARFRNLAALHAINYPVTAAILENIAKHYERDAGREDDQAFFEGLDS